MLSKTWDKVLENEYRAPYFEKLGVFIKNEYKTKIVFPEYSNIFKAFLLTDYEDVKVVILGQDPYHGSNEAHGLSFSVRDGINMPPSLKNIFKEIDNDLGIKRKRTDLTDWAKDGVLLLNSIMTVLKDKPLSHKDKGWEIFTDNVIKALGQREKPMVFVLWGSYARSKKELIKNSKHLILESVHPSPLSAHRGFFGSKPFSKINNFLKDNNIDEIKW